MGLQVVVEKVAVVKPGDTKDTIVHRGRMVPDWVDSFTEFVLVSTGMAKRVDEPDPALLAQANAPAPVALAEHAPHGSSTAPGGKTAEQGDAEAKAKADADRLAQAKAGEMPKRNASTDEWLAYAVSQRAEDVSEDDARKAAEDMTRAELIDKFGDGR